MKSSEVVIIGAGPAGIAAGIQLKRYGLEPVIFEKHKPGGLLRNANLVENYPGFPDGISGVDLVKLLEKQVVKFSLNIKKRDVTAVEYSDNLFEIKHDDEITRSKALLIASGTKPIEPSELSIPESLKDKVLYEVESLLKIKNKRIIVVGGGDAAFDYGLGFHSSNKVLIINRSSKTNCLELLRKKTEQSEHIEYRGNVTIADIARWEDRLGVSCVNHSGAYNIDADFLIFAIGREPSLDFLSEGLKNKSEALEKKGLLYYAGDVQNRLLRQTAIAVGDGLKAAMKIYSRLKESA